MRFRIKHLPSLAVLAMIASSAYGQGLGYPEAPHHTVTRAARYWYPDGYITRAWTGRIGFGATNGCDDKPICSLCDYSRRRVCDCQASHFGMLGNLTGGFHAPSIGSSGGCKSAQKGSACQKCSAPKHVATQKCAPRPKLVTQKYATQKCAPRPKVVTQKCAPQKCATQKCATQKCGKSKCSASCCPSLLDSVADHIASLDLFQRSSCGCKAKCSKYRPTLVKSKSKSKSGYVRAPSTLPHLERVEEGDAAPPADPAVPPAPMLDGADEVGSGARSADRSRGLWRRARTPGTSMPRLLPADNSARDVSRISYEELTKPEEAPRKLQTSTSGKRLDVFQSASGLGGASTQAAPKLLKSSESGVPANPLR